MEFVNVVWAPIFQACRKRGEQPDSLCICKLISRDASFWLKRFTELSQRIRGTHGTQIRVSSKYRWLEAQGKKHYVELVWPGTICC